MYCHLCHHDSPIFLMGELIMMTSTVNAHSMYVAIVCVMELTGSVFGVIILVTSQLKTFLTHDPQAGRLTLYIN